MNSSSSQVKINQRKYDRQLRLWGNRGQQYLQQAAVCLINANAVGTEILKNLILPGVERLVIVDNAKVTETDLSNNFFLLPKYLGKSRGEKVAKLLQELNKDASVNHFEADVDTILTTTPTYFTQFDMVIACNMPNSGIVQGLGRILWESRTNFVVVKSYGMVGNIRFVIPEHCVVEAHEDNTLHDLRCDTFFNSNRQSEQNKSSDSKSSCYLPELESSVKRLCLESLSDSEHRDVPSLVIVLYYLNKWMEQHGRKRPSNRQERNLFKQSICDGKTCVYNDDGKEGEMVNEENFDEAVSLAHYAWKKTSISPQTNKVFQECCADKIEGSQGEWSKKFWVMAQALKDFVHIDNNGALPLRGSLPDMSASTVAYTNLLKQYKEKAMQDQHIVTQRVEKYIHLYKLELDLIEFSDIQIMCQNACSLNVTYGTSLESEQTRVDDYNVYPEEPLYYYLGLRAVESFHEKYVRYPGVGVANYETDLPTLKNCLIEIQTKINSTRKVPISYLQELCRFGAIELSGTSSIVGGLAAQEICKILTKQYLPANNNIAIDTITGAMLTFRI